MRSLFLMLSLCGLALIGSVSGVRAQVLKFHVETPAAAAPAAELVALGVDESLQIKDASGVRTIPRFISLRQLDRTLPDLPTGNFVVLTNGDRIPLDADASAILDGSRLQVWPAKPWPELRKGLNLYVPNIVLLFWSLPDGVEDADLFFAKIEKEKRERDVLYLKNGDRVEGSLTALSGKDGGTIATDRGKLQMPWSRIAGIAWNTQRQVRLRAGKTHWRAALDGGARVNLLDVRFDEKSRRWTGVTQFGSTLELPEAGVLALDVREGAAVDLADLTPTAYGHKPYLGVSWPLRFDASAAGRPLRIGESTYERGLGAHAECRIDYKLDGKYQRFLATVGIDEASRRGRAKIAIALDGKRVDLNEGKELTRQTPPVPVAIDVRGVKSLSLIVERGAFGDVQAHVNWANARLVKTD